MIYGSKDDNRKVTISKYHSRTFEGIREIGFADTGEFCLDLWTTPPAEMRGGYCSTISISSKSYRDQNGTDAKAELLGSGIVIYDDWGNATRINADDNVIAALWAECVEQGLVVEAAT